MKDIVIAAGYATRLGELTKNFPKPLLKIGLEAQEVYCVGFGQYPLGGCTW